MDPHLSAKRDEVKKNSKELENKWRSWCSVEREKRDAQIKYRKCQNGEIVNTDEKIRTKGEFLALIRLILSRVKSIHRMNKEIEERNPPVEYEVKRARYEKSFFVIIESIKRSLEQWRDSVGILFPLELQLSEQQCELVETVLCYKKEEFSYDMCYAQKMKLKNMGIEVLVAGLKKEVGELIKLNEKFSTKQTGMMLKMNDSEMDERDRKAFERQVKKFDASCTKKLVDFAEFVGEVSEKDMEVLTHERERLMFPFQPKGKRSDVFLCGNCKNYVVSRLVVNPCSGVPPFEEDFVQKSIFNIGMWHCECGYKMCYRCYSEECVPIIMFDEGRELHHFATGIECPECERIVCKNLKNKVHSKTETCQVVLHLRRGEKGHAKIEFGSQKGNLILDSTCFCGLAGMSFHNGKKEDVESSITGKTFTQVKTGTLSEEEKNLMQKKALHSISAKVEKKCMERRREKN